MMTAGLLRALTVEIGGGLFREGFCKQCFPVSLHPQSGYHAGVPWNTVWELWCHVPMESFTQTAWVPETVLPLGQLCDFAHGLPP